MENKGFLVVDGARGDYLVVPQDGFEMPSSEPFIDSFRTPNGAMEKDGIDRYPFRSYDVNVTASPTISITGYNFSRFEELYANYEHHRTEGYTGPNGSNIALGIGGRVGGYTDRYWRSVCYAEWIRPGNDGYYVVSGSVTPGGSTMYMTYYCVTNGSLRYYPLGAMPASTYDSLDHILDLVYTYEPPVPGTSYSGAKEISFSVHPGVVPGNVVDRLQSALLPLADHDEGRIGYELINQFKITDINLPAFFVDLPAFGESTKDVLSSLGKLFTATSKKDAVKNLAKANLAYQYGDRLTVSDTRELLSKGKELGGLSGIFGPKTAKSKDLVVIDAEGVSGVDILRYTATAAPSDPLSKGIYGLANVFNYANVWDLIPFSFVVDWFLNVGDYLASHDAYTLDCIMTYSRIIRSRTLDVKLDKFKLDGSLLSGTFKLYERDKVSEVPAPDIDLQASLPRPAQWINGTSLLTSLSIK